jgi:hypothetical protein
VCSSFLVQSIIPFKGLQPWSKLPQQHWVSKTPGEIQLTVFSFPCGKVKGNALVLKKKDVDNFFVPGYFRGKLRDHIYLRVF